MARGGAAAADHDRQRDQLVDAALRVVGERGLGELTVRRIAEAAGTSTMSVYSRFGGRDGMLEAMYRRAVAVGRPPRHTFLFWRPPGGLATRAGVRAPGLRGGVWPLIEPG